MIYVTLVAIWEVLAVSESVSRTKAEVANKFKPW